MKSSLQIVGPVHAHSDPLGLTLSAVVADHLPTQRRERKCSCYPAAVQLKSATYYTLDSWRTVVYQYTEGGINVAQCLQ